MPSPLKSPTATETGLVPAASGLLGAALKLASSGGVWPSRIVTLSELKLAMARSGLPSPLKSPTATDSGTVAGGSELVTAAVKLPLPSPSRIVDVVAS